MPGRVVVGDGQPEGLPAGAPVDVWEDVAAIGAGWTPVAGEAELPPVPGRLELHEDALVFRANGTLDERTGAPLVSVVPAAAVREARPLLPGTKATPTRLAGTWMPGWQRRFRCPGFALVTDAGLWLFDVRRGEARAKALTARYGRREGQQT